MKKDSNECFDGRVTEWLPPNGACGPTGFEKCRSNMQWLHAERGRLARKGIGSHTETNEDGLVALFLDRRGPEPAQEGEET